MNEPAGGQLARWRPRRVRRSIARRLFERSVARGTPSLRRDDLETLGSSYGGWTIPLGAVRPGSVCYCVGAGSDISFDLTLAVELGCRVWCIDPGEAAERHVRLAAAGVVRLVFRRVALAREDGPLRLFCAADPASSSLSAVNLLGGTATVEAQGRSLASLMADHGHDRIDLLKLDIEGAEYDVLESVDLARCGVRVLCLELHHTVSLRRARRLIKRLNGQGFALVNRSAADFTFIRTRPAPARSRAGATGRRAGAAAVGSIAAASLWCGSLTGVLCVTTGIL